MNRSARVDAHAVLLAGGLVAGVALRFFGLNAQSYWGDEEYSWAKAILPVSDLIQGMAVDATHPPFHPLFLHVWFEMFGSEPASGRLFVALLGVATLPAIYWLGRELYDRQTAALGVVLLAVSQFGISYSQEVRDYSQLMLLTLLMLACYVRAVNRTSLAFWAAASVLAVIAILTHYFATFFVAGLALWHLVAARHRVKPSWVALTVAIGLASCVPWLVLVLQHTVESEYLQTPVYRTGFSGRSPFETVVAFANGNLQSVMTAATSPWAIASAAALFWGPLLVFLRRRPWVEAGLLAVVAVAATAATDVLWKWAPVLAVLAAAGPMTDVCLRGGLRRLANVAIALVAGAGLAWAQLRWAPYHAPFFFGMFLAGAALREWIPREDASTADGGRTWLLMSVVSASLAAGWLVEAVVALPHEVRFFLSALAPFYLLTASAVARFPAALRWSWVAAMIGFSVLGIRTHLETPYKENWRDALAIIHDQYQTGDCAAFTPWEPIAWTIYRYDDVTLRKIDRSRLQDPHAGCANLWLVSYSRSSDARDNSNADRARAARVRPLLDSWEFHWVRVDRFGAMNRQGD
jgi:4-amino-4-deoxy-L-arabinose transferase-like glycosyltransferase